MNRLLTELDRLYGMGPGAAGVPAAQHAADARAAVLAVVLPAGWEQLSPVWRGVQSDLELPAPAIAVSGGDALQLWFSFASPMPSSAAARFLRRLCEQYLPGVRSSQVRVFAEAAELPAAPCAEVGPQRWSAFVTHDLAAVFAETPWLDIPPSDEGQATILRALKPMPQVAFEAALSKLGAIDVATPPEPVALARAGSTAAQGAGPRETDPARFLADVMNDGTAPLALRIEAARILLSTAHRA